MWQKFMERILGRWQKVEAQEICFPICITIMMAEMSDIIILEHWSLEDLQGEGLDNRLQLLQSVLALGTIAAIHSLSLSLMTGTHAGVPRTAYTQLAGTRVGKNDSVLQISELCALITLLLLITEVHTDRQSLFLYIPPFLQPLPTS